MQKLLWPFNLREVTKLGASWTWRMLQNVRWRNKLRLWLTSDNSNWLLLTRWWTSGFWTRRRIAWQRELLPASWRSIHSISTAPASCEQWRTAGQYDEASWRHLHWRQLRTYSAEREESRHDVGRSVCGLPNFMSVLRSRESTLQPKFRQVSEADTLVPWLILPRNWTRESVEPSYSHDIRKASRHLSHMISMTAMQLSCTLGPQLIKCHSLPAWSMQLSFYSAQMFWSTRCHAAAVCSVLTVRTAYCILP